MAPAPARNLICGFRKIPFGGSMGQPLAACAPRQSAANCKGQADLPPGALGACLLPSTTSAAADSRLVASRQPPQPPLPAASPAHPGQQVPENHTFTGPPRMPRTCCPQLEPTPSAGPLSSHLQGSRSGRHLTLESKSQNLRAERAVVQSEAHLVTEGSTHRGEGTRLKPQRREAELGLQSLGF